MGILPKEAAHREYQRGEECPVLFGQPHRGPLGRDARATLLLSQLPRVIHRSNPGAHGERRAHGAGQPLLRADDGFE